MGFKSDTAAPLLTHRRNRPSPIGIAKTKTKTKIRIRIRIQAICTMCNVRTCYIEAPHCHPSQCHSRVKLQESIDEYYERMRMTCSSSMSPSTSGTSSSSSCSSGMKRSCEESRSTDTVCMMDSPLAIKQEEEEEISHKLKMTKVDDRSSRLVSRCSRVMDSLAREIKLVGTLANIRGDIQARQDLAMKWKSTALKQTLDPRSMTHLARLKTRIYLENKVHAAMHRSTSRLNLVC